MENSEFIITLIARKHCIKSIVYRYIFIDDRTSYDDKLSKKPRKDDNDDAT